MTTQQTEAWKRVRNAGTVNLIIGILGIIGFVILFVIAMILIVANFEIPGDAGEAPLPSAVLGVIFIIIALVLLLPFGIVDIIAGVKMRKPVPHPKGWIIYTIVIGALNAGSIPGIIQLVFGILALSSSSDLETSQPPATQK